MPRVLIFILTVENPQRIIIFKLTVEESKKSSMYIGQYFCLNLYSKIAIFGHVLCRNLLYTVACTGIAGPQVRFAPEGL
jgi:hypothetical protein